MTEPTLGDVIHQLKDYIAVIVSFCDVLLPGFPADDPRRADLVEVDRAARAAMAVVPEVARRVQARPHL